jgi:hypothetical protein
MRDITKSRVIEKSFMCYNFNLVKLSLVVKCKRNQSSLNNSLWFI